MCFILHNRFCAAVASLAVDAPERHDVAVLRSLTAFFFRLFCVIPRYNIPEQCRLDLTETDIKFAKSLLEKVVPIALAAPNQSSQEQNSTGLTRCCQDYVKRRKEWVDELNIMLKMKKKAEIQARSLLFEHLQAHFWLRSPAHTLLPFHYSLSLLSHRRCHRLASSKFSLFISP